MPGSSSLVAKCIPVFVKVRRCIYRSRYPHTTTITLSSIVVSDLLVMTSLLEQAPDWLTQCEYPPKFRFFNSREKKRSIRAIRTASFSRISPQDCLSRLCIDLTCKSFARYASFASGVNAPLVFQIFVSKMFTNFLGPHTTRLFQECDSCVPPLIHEVRAVEVQFFFPNSLALLLNSHKSNK